MALHTVELAHPSSLGDCREEIAPITSVLPDYTNVVIGFQGAEVAPGHEILYGEQVVEAFGPLISKLVSIEEVQNPNPNGELHIAVDTTKQILHGESRASKWISVKPYRYFIADTLPPEFLTGKLLIDATEEIFTIGAILRTVNEAGAKLPDTEIFVPAPSELVQAEPNHLYRLPAHKHGESIIQTLVKAQVYYLPSRRKYINIPLASM